MTDIFLERTFDPPLTTADFEAMVEAGASCFGIYRVDWGGSLMSADGKRLFCQFSGPDAESVRTALRQADANAKLSSTAPRHVDVKLTYLWPGTIHDAPDTSAEAVANSNVLVQRRFEEPVQLEEIQAIEDKGAACLEMRNVRFVRTFFSTDRKHMICLYHAPDAESVRQAQLSADMPFEDIWAFRRFRAEA